MSEAMEFLLGCLWYLAPMGVANTAPVLMRGSFRALAVPVDRFLGRRGIFGAHKTVRGLFFALPFGGAAFLLERALAAATGSPAASFFDYQMMTPWFGVLAGAGAITGDLVRSAIKRRVGIRPGGRFVPFDQIDYLIGGMVFTAPLFRPSWGIVLGVLVVGGLLHAFCSGFAYVLGLKKDRL